MNVYLTIIKDHVGDTPKLCRKLIVDLLCRKLLHPLIKENVYCSNKENLGVAKVGVLYSGYFSPG